LALYRTSCKVKSELSTKCWRPWSSNTSRCSEFGSAGDDPKRLEGYREMDEEKKRKEQMMQASKNQTVLLLLNTGDEVTGLGSPDVGFMDSGGR